MILALLLMFIAQDDLSKQLATIKRVYVDKLTGGETAAQMRDLLMSSLENAKLFIVTENQEHADMILRGAAEDLIFTDSFSSSEGINMHGVIQQQLRPGHQHAFQRRGLGLRFAQRPVVHHGRRRQRILNTKERKHEALATVRLVNKDGDVIWSTTQESTGAKFRGASADVAEKIARQLAADVEKVKKTGK